MCLENTLLQELVLLTLCMTVILNGKKMRPLQIDFYPDRINNKNEFDKKNHNSTMAFRVFS